VRYRSNKCKKIPIYFLLAELLTRLSRLETRVREEFLTAKNAKNAKNAKRETRILNREIRGIHEGGEETWDSLKGVSREIFTEMIDLEILHCKERTELKDMKLRNTLNTQKTGNVFPRYPVAVQSSLEG